MPGKLPALPICLTVPGSGKGIDLAAKIWEASYLTERDAEIPPGRGFAFAADKFDWMRRLFLEFRSSAPKSALRLSG
jgi:hypothetical protein